MLTQFYFKQFSLAIARSFKCPVLLSKTCLFQIIQLSQTVLIQPIQFSISMQFVLFNPYIGPYQVLTFRIRVDLRAKAMKICSAFHKAPASLDTPTGPPPSEIVTTI